MTAPERVMQTIKYSFFVSGLLLIFVMVRIPVKSPTVANHVFEIAITAMALINLFLGLFGRPFFARLANYNPPNSKTAPIQRWMAANIFSLACIDACMLFGLVLHFLRGRAVLVELLFAAAMVSLLFWSPGAPPSTDDPQTSIS
jgi:hypothetical protein